jgi:hypothetical protein
MPRDGSSLQQATFFFLDRKLQPFKMIRNACMQTHTDRQRERETETERDRDRNRERQRQRETERDRERQRETERERQTDKHGQSMYICTFRSPQHKQKYKVRGIQISTKNWNSEDKICMYVCKQKVQ